MSNSEVQKRPLGISLLSFLFAWLALAGAGNGWNALNGVFPDVPPAFAYLGFAYAATALISAVGLWLMKAWSLHVLYSWMVLCLVLFFVVGGFEGGGLLGRLGFLVFIMIAFIGLHRYVSTRLVAIARPAGDEAPAE
ncbi:MAG: hypothetical protein ACI9JM_001964 [Halioglobus sp.]